MKRYIIPSLGFALRSRVLTDEEMAKVERLGCDIFVEDGVPYSRSEIEQLFSEALLNQFKMRYIAQEGSGETFKANLLAWLREDYAAMQADENTGPDIMVEISLKMIIDRIENGDFDGPDQKNS